MPDPPNYCPNCGASFRYQHQGVTYFRVISIVNHITDRHDHWTCPDCGHEWNEVPQDRS